MYDKKAFNEAKHTQEELKEMQSWDLDKKINVTITRIIEWYQRWGGGVVVSFSGGKDSTVLLDIARRVNKDIKAVFFDTGLEFPEIRDFVKTYDNVDWVKPKMNFRQIIKKYGYMVISKDLSTHLGAAKEHPTSLSSIHTFGLGDNHEGQSNYAKQHFEKYRYMLNAPFKVSSRCCNLMKKQPAKDYEKRTGRKPIIGMTCEESLLRQQSWLLYGCNAFEGNHPRSMPMAFWTEQDILKYIYISKLPIASVYGDIIMDGGKYRTTGYARTGCVWCAAGAHCEYRGGKFGRFQLLALTHPKLYEYCMRDFDKGGLGLKTVCDWCHIPTDPLTPAGMVNPFE